MIALLTWSEFMWLPPICLAIAVVTAASHRDDMREIFKHGMRAWLILMIGIFVFANGISLFFEWMLPG